MNINYNEIVARMPFDVRAEVLAAKLLETDPELRASEQIHVRPRGNTQRNAGRDVLFVSEPWYDNNGNKHIYIDVSREGLYDVLPSVMFIHPDEHFEDDVEKSEQLAKQSADARKFLLPFEEVFFHTRLAIETLEQQVLTHPEEILALFLNGNDDDTSPSVDARRQQALTLFLPLIDQVIGDTELCRQTLEKLLGMSVSIKIAPPEPINIPSELQSVMGKAALGESFVMGSTFFDGIPVNNIRIVLEKAETALLWIPGAQERLFAEKTLFPLLFSFDTPVVLEVDVFEKARDFTLSDDSPSALLGYVTYL